MSEEFTFDSKEELINYLHKMLKKLNKMDEFMVLAHQVNSYRNFMSDGSPMEKLKSILHGGLSASSYGSIDGTTTRVGSTKNPLTAKQTVSYNYHHVPETICYPTVLLTLPRFVMVNGKKTEFCESKYLKTAKSRLDPLKALLESKNIFTTPNTQYTPKCWADVIKGFGNFNKKDTLCAFYRTDEGKYTLVVPHTHWSDCNPEEYQEHKNTLSKKIESYNMSLEDAIAKEERERRSYIDSLLDSID